MSALGQVLTFYSYKGGVGRSMGLANVATLLAKWRRKVLVVDWDLEAPGIESYFKKLIDLSEERKQKPGVVDLVQSIVAGETLNWQDCLLSVPLPEKFEFAEDIKIISAGKNDGEYMSRAQHINWDELFLRHDLGVHLETLRNNWKEKYDFILIDSRTGITDIGGVCTIHLPDYLAIWFTTNETSVQGVKDVAERARAAQINLPFDKKVLPVLPVPSRDESTAEFEKALEWQKIFAKTFSEFYREWTPVSVEPADVVGKLRIPYVAYWSFGEGLPVAEEDTSGLSDAYELLAKLIFFKLEWKEIDKSPEQSIEYLSSVVELDVNRFGPELADTLFNQAFNLWKEGHEDGSSQHTRKAIEIWKKLTTIDPKVFGLKLARAQKFLSGLLEESDVQGSISVATEAINIYKSLSEIAPSFDEEVAAGLTELAYRLNNSGEVERPIETLREAIDIQRRLAESNPRRFEPDLARGLYDLSNWFIEGEQFSDGLAAIQEAVSIYRRLTSGDKNKYEPELADSLITLSECLLETGDIDGAVVSGREAADIYKRLFLKSPKQYLSNLVKSFNGLLDTLSRVDINSMQGALSSVQEAVEFFRGLVQEDSKRYQEDPKRYQPDLAKSLNMLPEPLLKGGHIEEALLAQQEAIELFRSLKQTNPTQYEPDLASSLIFLSKLFREKGDIPAAQVSAQEAVEIFERLSKDSPSRYQEDLKEAMELAK